jgi:hypothetical protein
MLASGDLLWMVTPTKIMWFPRVCRFPGTRLFFLKTTLESITSALRRIYSFPSSISLCKAFLVHGLCIAVLHHPSWTRAQRQRPRPSLGGLCPTRQCGEWRVYVVVSFLCFVMQNVTGKKHLQSCWTLDMTFRNGQEDWLQVCRDTAKSIRPVQLLIDLFENSIQSHQRVCASNSLGSRQSILQMWRWLTLRRNTRMDDPLVWGILPARFWNKRWSFGSYDICYQTRYLQACADSSFPWICLTDWR